MEDGEDDSDPLSSLQKKFESLRCSRLLRYVFICVLTSEFLDLRQEIIRQLSEQWQ